MGGYILSNQRFYPPNWVPVLGTDFFEVKAEFSTAQSVTPGQGQTVDIAGVPVGEIKNVDLENGRAIVTMADQAQVREADQARRDDAPAAEDRPEGHGRSRWIRARRGRRGARAASRSRSPRPGRTSTSTRSSSSLDRDTRDYLRLLVAAEERGFENNGRNFSNAFRRFAPLNRDITEGDGRGRQAPHATSRA